MAIDGGSGSNALDRLATRLEEDMVCPDCGYDDRTGHWRAKATGSAIVYRHDCPGCGATHERRITLDE